MRIATFNINNIKRRLPNLLDWLKKTSSPDIVCLQEVPVWALPKLAAWSGFDAFAAVAERGLRPTTLAGWITRLANGHLRSAISGQANAILVRPEHDAADLGLTQISDRGRERRVCQAVRVGDIVVANLHASTVPPAALEEVERARDGLEHVRRSSGRR